MPDDELCYLTAAELAELICRREVSPVEIVEAHLERISAYNGTLNAFLHISGEEALSAARAAEMEIGANGYRGALHGLPVAYKDIFHVQGQPTTAGSKIMADYRATEDSTVAARLRAAGAICLGKLNTFEFACGGMETFGDARNPWNTALTPGGSSAGSGTALAAYLVPLATGSDTGGSIRNPAAFCGVVGLKPTYGRVSRAGIVPLSWSLDAAGPMARTVTDIALLLQAMAGPDRRDPSAAFKTVPDYQAVLLGAFKGTRLGVPQTFFFEEGDPDTLAGVHTALEVMRQLGAVIVEVDLPHVKYGHAAQWAIAFSEAFAFHRANLYRRPHDYTRACVYKVASAAFLTAEERVAAQRIRQVITTEFLAALRDVDAIVTPAAAYPANPLGSPYPGRDTGLLTRAVSLAGLPALALPCGFTSGGLPVSLQLIGRAWEEATLLRIGAAYERATEWYRRRPPLSAATVENASPPSTKSADQTMGATLDARWVLDYARLTGLSFITEADAEPLAATVGPMKAQLAVAREQLDSSVEPPVRAAP